MTFSFFPISKNKLQIPAGGFLDVELLTPGDKNYYVKTLYCNKDEIGVELKDDQNEHTSEPFNMGYFKEETNEDLKLVFGPAQRLCVKNSSSVIHRMSFAR